MNYEPASALQRDIDDADAWIRQMRSRCRLDTDQQAIRGLQAVLHALRDRLTVEQAAHLGTMLPVLIRGIYFGGWEPAGKPTHRQELAHFLDDVSVDLPPEFPCLPVSVAEAACELLGRELGAGGMAKIGHALPGPLHCHAGRASRH